MLIVVRFFKNLLSFAYFFDDFRDEDMQSMASMMSANNNSDIGHLDDFDDEDISFTENSTSFKQVNFESNY